MAEQLRHYADSSLRVRRWRTTGALALSGAMLLPTSGCGIFDEDFPDCGTTVEIKANHTPAAFIENDGETYSLYMPQQFAGEQQVTIVRGRIEGERAESTPVHVRMRYEGSDDIQRVKASLPDGGADILLEYDATTRQLKTSCK